MFGQRVSSNHSRAASSFGNMSNNSITLSPILWLRPASFVILVLYIIGVGLSSQMDNSQKYYPRASGPSPSTPATRPERFLRITAFFRITAFVLGRLWRGMGGILPPRRSPPLPTPSGLVPPRRTPNEPMPRQTNVLDCPNESTLYMTMTPDRTAPGTVPLNRYNRLAWTSHHEARHGAAVRGKTVRTRSGSSGALLPCSLLAVTGNRPAMPGGPVACYGVSPGDDQALGMTACTMRRRPQ